MHHAVEFGALFFGFLDALQQNNLAKILAQPNIVAVSGLYAGPSGFPMLPAP